MYVYRIFLLDLVWKIHPALMTGGLCVLKLFFSLVSLNSTTPKYQLPFANCTPVLLNKLAPVKGYIGQAFVHDIPDISFYDIEYDIYASGLLLKIQNEDGGEISKSSWIKIRKSGKTWQVYGFPLDGNKGEHIFRILGTNNRGKEVSAMLHVSIGKKTSKFSHAVSLTMQNSIVNYVRDLNTRFQLVERLGMYLLRGNYSHVWITSYSTWTKTIVFTLNTIEYEPCDESELSNLKSKLLTDDDEINTNLLKAFRRLPFKLKNVQFQLLGPCEPKPDEDGGNSIFGWLKHLLPIVILFCVVGIPVLIAYCVHKKRPRPPVRRDKPFTYLRGENLSFLHPDGTKIQMNNSTSSVINESLEDITEEDGKSCGNENPKLQPSNSTAPLVSSKNKNIGFTKDIKGNEDEKLIKNSNCKTDNLNVNTTRDRPSPAKTHNNSFTSDSTAQTTENQQQKNTEAGPLNYLTGLCKDVSEFIQVNLPLPNLTKSEVSLPKLFTSNSAQKSQTRTPEGSQTAPLQRKQYKRDLAENNSSMYGSFDEAGKHYQYTPEDDISKAGNLARGYGTRYDDHSQSKMTDDFSYNDMQKYSFDQYGRPLDNMYDNMLNEQHHYPGEQIIPYNDIAKGGYDNTCLNAEQSYYPEHSNVNSDYQYGYPHGDPCKRGSEYPGMLHTGGIPHDDITKGGYNYNDNHGGYNDVPNQGYDFQRGLTPENFLLPPVDSCKVEYDYPQFDSIKAPIPVYKQQSNPARNFHNPASLSVPNVIVDNYDEIHGDFSSSLPERNFAGTNTVSIHHKHPQAGRLAHRELFTKGVDDQFQYHDYINPLNGGSQMLHSLSSSFGHSCNDIFFSQTTSDEFDVDEYREMDVYHQNRIDTPLNRSMTRSLPDLMQAQKNPYSYHTDRDLDRFPHHEGCNTYQGEASHSGTYPRATRYNHNYTPEQSSLVHMIKSGFNTSWETSDNLEYHPNANVREQGV